MKQIVLQLTKLISPILLAVFFVHSANALPIFSRPSPRSLIGQTNGPLNGIVALPGCSGSVVRFSNDSKAKAVVLTNGHCIDLIKPGVFLENVKYERNLKFYTGDNREIRVSSIRILYATMTGTDIALLETQATYEDLARQNIQPLLISPEFAPQGTPIVMVSGLFKTVARCKVDGFAFQLKEADWMWKNSYRYAGCDAVHGTSGSPLISEKTGQIIGINNTGNDDGGRCTLNNPCEIDEQGKVTVIQGMNYGQHTNIILSCVKAGQLDLKTKSCALFGAAQFRGFRF